MVLSLATALLVGRAVFAAPTRGEVKILVAGSDRAFSAIAKSLTEALSFIAVTAQFEHSAAVDPRSISENQPSPQSHFARLWIDAAAAHEIILYITDAGGERVFVRRIGLDHGLDTVAVESLALVAQSSLEALLAGKLIGMTRDDYEHSLDVAAPLPAPKRVTVRTPAPTLRLDQGESRDTRPSRWHLSAGYQMQAWDRVTMRHEAALGIEYQRWTLRFDLSLFSTWPIQFHSGQSGAELFSNGIRLQVSRPVALARQWHLVPGLGFAVELTRIRPELGSADQPASPYFAVDPILRAVLAIERSLGRWSLRGIVGLDLATRPVQYVVTDQSGSEPVRTPWQLRPFGAIVLAAGL